MRPGITILPQPKEFTCAIFASAGSKNVSANFTPVLEEGTFQVRIVIDGQDLGGMDYQAKYKIVC
jgi:hypothetical protein